MRTNVALKKESITYDEDGEMLVTFRIRNRQMQQQVKELEKNEWYSASIVKPKSLRSYNQNAFMWEIIHKIALARNGKATFSNEWEIYIDALEQAEAKFEYIQIPTKAEKMLRDTDGFRAFKKLNSFINDKGFEIGAYKVFIGSSKMNVKEMGELLDTVLDLAAKEGVFIEPIINQ